MSDWRTITPLYTESGMQIDGKSIVETWEKDIQKKMARSVLGNKGLRILEIGYGLGFCAKEINNLEPSLHIIIEAHPLVHEKALQEMPSQTKIILDFWEQTIKYLLDNQFDAIVFDAYPMDAMPFDGSAENTFAQVKPFLKEGYRLLDKNGRLAFLDFSGMVTKLNSFENEAKAYSDIEIQNVSVQPQESCTYATSEGGSIVILTK